jgi:hypothetical protein
MGVFFRPKFTGIISRGAKTIFLPQFALRFSSHKSQKIGVWVWPFFKNEFCCVSKKILKWGFCAFKLVVVRVVGVCFGFSIGDGAK